MFRLIQNMLVPCDLLEAQNSSDPYTAVFTRAEWKEYTEHFDLSSEDLDLEDPVNDTRIDVRYRSLTGRFHLPLCFQQKPGFASFFFLLDAKKILFIDDTGTAEGILKQIAEEKQWKQPSLERFLYDFLETMTSQDGRHLEEYEKKLNTLEQQLTASTPGKEELIAINRIRGELLDLKDHYEQLIDLSQELEENENDFFKEENLRYFRLFTIRAERLRDSVASLREYTIQLRDLYQTQLDIRQNRLMATLTILTTIFFPLTLITGWYGMNFVYMPELKLPFFYPVLIVICILIVTAEICWFRNRKYW